MAALEVVNLLIVGMTSFNLKAQVPNDIPDHNQYIPSNNLKSQDYPNKINLWTKKKKMPINEKKRKTMIINFTNNYQFTTRLQLNQQNIEVVREQKLVGTIIQKDLKWDSNTANLTKRGKCKNEIIA